MPFLLKSADHAALFLHPRAGCDEPALSTPAAMETPMKLYFAPGTCSLASHITLHELGVSFDLEKVNLKTKQTAKGDDYMQVNPKGYVPALGLDDGVLTENVAVLLYLADLKPDVGLAPAKKSFERYRLLEWLAFVSSEIHKSYTPYFLPDANDDEKRHATEKLSKRLEYVEQALGDKEFLMGNRFTVADAYLYTVLTWASIASLDLSKWPKVQAYFQRVEGREAVRKARDADRAA